MIDECKRKNIPIIHSCSKRKLGASFTGKFGPKVSVISIINYQGYEELFNELI